MSVLFYIASAVALLSTLLVITRKNAVHAALYLVVSLLSVAMCFFALGAPLAGALEIIVYAGAILVLLLFVIMLLDQRQASLEQERRWLPVRGWIGPTALTLILVGLLFYVAWQGETPVGTSVTVEARRVARSLFGSYAVGVELASLLLLAGLVTAYHLGVRDPAGNQEPPCP